MLARRLCWDCNYWHEFEAKLELEHAKMTIIDGHVYGPGNRTSGEFRGMAGRRFDIEYIEPSVHAGKRITTFDLWSGSTLPETLKARFPAIAGPGREDICYATTNRQAAVKAVAPKIDALLVIGAPNSSNSRRLVEVGAAAGCSYSMLIQRAADIDWRALGGARSIGLTAGARGSRSSEPNQPNAETSARVFGFPPQCAFSRTRARRRPLSRSTGRQAQRSGFSCLFNPHSVSEEFQGSG